jgi:hypothetical protein
MATSTTHNSPADPLKGAALGQDDTLSYVRANFTRIRVLRL